MCTLFIVSITRAPAIHRQFHAERIPDLFLKIESIYRKAIYYFLMIANISAGIFSSAGAYLGTITIIEFVAITFNHPIVNTWQVTLAQLFSLFIAASSFAAFYSFNMHKAKINSIKLASLNKKNSNALFSKTAFKTLIVSLLNIISLPFIAYFLTKHAFHKMPCLLSYVSSNVIKCIAFFSAITALVSSLTTTVAAMYEYFGEVKSSDHNESTFLASFRYITYMTGIVDCSAGGLGAFLGVLTVTNDLFFAPNQYVILLAIGSALSYAVLIFSFSVRQGFNDVIEYIHRRKIISTTS